MKHSDNKMKYVGSKMKTSANSNSPDKKNEEF